MILGNRFFGGVLVGFTCLLILVYALDRWLSSGWPT